MSDSLWPHGLWPTRLLCPWDFPGKNTRVGSHFLLQGIFVIQESHPRLLHWQADSLPLSHRGSLNPKTPSDKWDQKQKVGPLSWPPLPLCSCLGNGKPHHLARWLLFHFIWTWVLSSSMRKVFPTFFNTCLKLNRQGCALFGKLNVYNFYKNNISSCL